MAKVLTRNNMQWSEAEFHSFIKGALRSLSLKWPPLTQTIKDARVAYGTYKCEMCGETGPPTLPPEEGKKRRRKNIIADHIAPVVDPVEGFVSWDVLIERMFVEREGFQALCAKCHKKKTAEETAIRTEARRKRKIITKEGDVNDERNSGTSVACVQCVDGTGGQDSEECGRERHRSCLDS